MIKIYLVLKVTDVNTSLRVRFYLNHSRTPITAEKNHEWLWNSTFKLISMQHHNIRNTFIFSTDYAILIITNKFLMQITQ